MNIKLLTVAEAAKKKGVSRSAIYKAIDQGRIKAQITLGRLALSEDDVRQWQPHIVAGWPKGKKVSAETKAKISASQKCRWAKRKEKSRG
jgi:excisionase family DNA binding protein